MDHDVTVFVVDDEEQARNSVCALVSSMGLRTRSYKSGEDFLREYRGERGCLVADLRMPGMSGLDLQEHLVRQDHLLPVVIITGFARTALTVRAMKAGAVTLLDKPYADDELWAAIRTALAREAGLRQQHQRRLDLRARLESLSPLERKVLDMVVAGRPNKAIAADLGLSLRTIENRRHDLLGKLQVHSVPELVRLIVEARQSLPDSPSGSGPNSPTAGNTGSV